MLFQYLRLLLLIKCIDLSPLPDTHCAAICSALNLSVKVAAVPIEASLSPSKTETFVFFDIKYSCSTGSAVNKG